jgi:hypothetical protein
MLSSVPQLTSLDLECTHNETCLQHAGSSGMQRGWVVCEGDVLRTGTGCRHRARSRGGSIVGAHALSDEKADVAQPLSYVDLGASDSGR